MKRRTQKKWNARRERRYRILAKRRRGTASYQAEMNFQRLFDALLGAVNVVAWDALDEKGGAHG